MHIDWPALGAVALVSLVAAVLLIALFAAGVRSLGRRADAVERGAAGTGAAVGATACFGLFAAVAAFGVLLLAVPGLFG